MLRFFGTSHVMLACAAAHRMHGDMHACMQACVNACTNCQGHAPTARSMHQLSGAYYNCQHLHARAAKADEGAYTDVCAKPFSHCLYGCETWTWTKVQMGRLEVTCFNCLHCIVGVKLTDHYRLETIHEQCGTSSLELMVLRWTLHQMGALLVDFFIMSKVSGGRWPCGTTEVSTGSQ
eukprot:365561-Chlamydomonas_euryale.AAC.2